MHTEKNQLLQESLGRLFLKFAIPALLAMVVTGIQGIVDGIFVGNFVGPNAMAAVTMASPFTQIILGVAIIISIGAQSHVGIRLGMGDHATAQNTVQTCLRLLLLIAALLTLLGFFFGKQIALLLGANEVLLPETTIYVRTLSLFSLPICLMLYFGFMNRIIEKPMRYLIGNLLTLGVNITLDYVFLAKLELGIFGAALATGIAYSAALLVVAPTMLSRKSLINMRTGRFHLRTLAPVLYNGSSEGVNSLSIALTAFLFNISLISLAGEGGVTAFTAINYIGTFGSLILFGISDGVGPVVSYNYGYGSYARVKKLMRLAYAVNALSGLLLFVALFFFGRPLVGIFISDEALIELAVHGGRLYAFGFLLSGFNILTSGYFTFIGKGLESVLIAASRGLVFVGLGIAVLPRFFAIGGVWLTVPFAETMAFLLCLLLLRKNRLVGKG